jgi:hypothetical protein
MIANEYSGPLRQVRFPLAKLDEFVQSVQPLHEALSEYRAADADSEQNELRKRAFTLMKRAVGEVREYGRYVFWEDPERAARYASDYGRSQRRRATGDERPASVQTCEAAAAEA